MALRQLCKNCTNTFSVKFLHSCPPGNLHLKLSEPYNSWHTPCMYIRTEQQFFHTPPFTTTGCLEDIPILFWHPPFLFRQGARVAIISPIGDIAVR